MVASCSSIRRTSHWRRPKRHWRPGRRNAMRIRLKGLNSVSKILAGGVVTYYYAWKGGPRLTGEPGTPEFIASYHEAVSAKKSAPPGAVLALLQAYQASSEFTGLRDRTRADYIKRIKQIEVALATCLSTPSRLAEHGLNSWRGVMISRPALGARRTTPGLSSPASSLGRKTAVSCPKIPANAEAVSTEAIAPTRSGPPRRGSLLPLSTFPPASSGPAGALDGPAGRGSSSTILVCL